MHNSRIDYFDIAKGIGIISVILGHGIITGLGHNFIYSFHMPLFFLISGYFFKERKNKIYLSICFKRLVVPYIFTCFCLIIITVLNSYIIDSDISHSLYKLKLMVLSSIYGSGRNNNFLFQLDIIYIGAVWFLLALFFSLTINNFFVANKYYIYWILLISYIGFETSKNIWFPFSVQAGMTMSSLVFIGHYAKNKKLFLKPIPNQILILMLSLWVYCIYYGNVAVVANKYNNVIIDLLGGVCGTYFIIRLSILIEKHTAWLSKVLTFFGRNSLVVLCFHLIELETLPWNDIRDFITYDHIVIENFFIISIKILWATGAIFIAHKFLILRKIFCIKSN